MTLSIPYGSYHQDLTSLPNRSWDLQTNQRNSARKIFFSIPWCSSRKEFYIYVHPRNFKTEFISQTLIWWVYSPRLSKLSYESLGLEWRSDISVTWKINELLLIKNKRFSVIEIKEAHTWMICTHRYNNYRVYTSRIQIWLGWLIRTRGSHIDSRRIVKSHSSVMKLRVVYYNIPP